MSLPLPTDAVTCPHCKGSFVPAVTEPTLCPLCLLKLKGSGPRSRGMIKAQSRPYKVMNLAPRWERH